VRAFAETRAARPPQVAPAPFRIGAPDDAAQREADAIAIGNDVVFASEEGREMLSGLNFIAPPGEIVTGPGGETQQTMTTIPSVKGPKDPLMDQPNIGGMLTIDFTRLPIVPERLRWILGGGAGERKR
jgi:hypothetical protein